MEPRRKPGLQHEPRARRRLSLPIYRGGLLAIAFLASLAGCVASPDVERSPSRETSEDSALPAWRYDVAITPALDVIRTRLCFHGLAPDAGWLIPGEPECARFLESAELLPRGGQARSLAVDGARGIELVPLSEGDCLRWEVDAARAARTDSERVAERVGEDLVTSPDLWLYRPGRGVGDVEMRAVFDLPAGVRVSTPWPREERAGITEHLVQPTVWRWLNRVVFGRFPLLEVEVEGATLEVAIMDGPRRMSDPEVASWIQRSATAVSTVYGRFPRPFAQVTVTPVSSWGNDAVPFGKVVRGGGPGVHLLLAQDARWPASFDDDWVTVHEMSHLTTPYIKDGGRWLSEGVATYYQTVLRARAGLLDEETAWQKLHEGFERGAANGRRGITLREASLDMWSETNFLRVYWSGTFFALAADLALRTRAAPSSLDEALARFGACCLEENRSWDDRELLAALDEKVGGAAFTGLAEELLPARAFPSVEATWRALGIEIQRGRVRLGGNDAQRALRRGILGPRQRPP